LIWPLQQAVNMASSVNKMSDTGSKCILNSTAAVTKTGIINGNGNHSGNRNGTQQQTASQMCTSLQELALCIAYITDGMLSDSSRQHSFKPQVTRPTEARLPCLPSSGGCASLLRPAHYFLSCLSHVSALLLSFLHILLLYQPVQQHLAQKQTRARHG
jgi:hypothetical protein